MKNNNNQNPLLYQSLFPAPPLKLNKKKNLFVLFIIYSFYILIILYSNYKEIYIWI